MNREESKSIGEMRRRRKEKGIYLRDEKKREREREQKIKRATGS